MSNDVAVIIDSPANVLDRLDPPAAVAMPDEARLIPGQVEAWEAADAERRTATRAAARVRKALQMEYDPVSILPNWYEGDAVHECSWRDRLNKDNVRGVAFVLGILVAFGVVIAGVVVFGDMKGLDAVLAALAIMVAALVSGGVVALAIDSLATGKHEQDWHQWYRRPLPEKALQAYLRARDAQVFDRILILCPDRAAFQAHTPRAVATDPLMIGVIDKGLARPEEFLI